MSQIMGLLPANKYLPGMSMLSGFQSCLSVRIDMLYFGSLRFFANKYNNLESGLFHGESDGSYRCCIQETADPSLQ